MKLPLQLWLAVILVLGGNSILSGAAPAQDPATVEAQTPLSPAASEILKMVDAGVEDEVMLGYISNSTNRFDLTADNLIFLKQSGVPSKVTTAMLQRDQEQSVKTPVIRQIASTPRLAPATTQTTPQNPTVPPSISNATPAVTQFYQALAPYGSWFQLEGWGWVWQPREATANSDWRPYVDDGRWLWTDHGWYWESDYPWGWAAFHYGRWQQMEKLGWVWFPDTVWAPSWVTWRYHDNYLGWAPLPPNAFADRRIVDQPVVTSYDFGLPQQSYTFVNIQYVFVRNVGHHRLPPTKVKDFYGKCKVVNDFAPGKNYSVANKGYPIDRVTAATGRRLNPVPAHPIADRDKRTAWAPAQPIFKHQPHPGTQPDHFAQPIHDPSAHSGRPTRPGSTMSHPRATTFAHSPVAPVVAPMNPITPPMNPIAAPMNPIVTPPAIPHQSAPVSRSSFQRSFGDTPTPTRENWDKERKGIRTSN